MGTRMFLLMSFVNTEDASYRRSKGMTGSGGVLIRELEDDQQLTAGTTIVLCMYPATLALECVLVFCPLQP